MAELCDDAGGHFGSAGVAPRDTHMMDDFSDEARTILATAEREARQFNHEFVGTEHILLAIVDEKSGLVAETLQSLGVRADAIRGEVEKLVQRGDRTATLHNLPLTPRAKQVIEFASEEARYWSQKQVGVEHLVIGLVREQDGVAGQVLRNLGFEPRGLARAVLKSRVQQMKIVERAVRPVRASTPCKRRMREELLAHLTEIYEQEMSRLHDPNAAIEEAAQRFGDPSELSRELETALPYHERISYWMERWFAWRAPESIVRYSLRLAILSFSLLLFILGVVGMGITLRYGWVPEVKNLCRVFASVLIVVPAAQFLVGVLYYHMRDSMWGVFGSRKSIVRALAFDGLIALIVTCGFAGLIGLATWDGTKAIESLSICGFAGLAAAMIWLATALFTGRSEIRDTVWAYLNIDGAE